MAKFARKIEFNAYQFVPENVTTTHGEGSIDDLVDAALPNMEMSYATITPAKLDMFKNMHPEYLTLNIYDSDGAGDGKETYVLQSGDWIYELDEGEYEVCSDEQWKKMGFEPA